MCFFFFKQKTAYEMRISDWSSDVCSSDLLTVARNVEYEIVWRIAGNAARDIAAQAALDRSEEDKRGKPEAERGDQRPGRAAGTVQIGECSAHQRAERKSVV